MHPRHIFAQYMGRVGGLTRGRDGNMHMGDLNRHIVADHQRHGRIVPVAAGAALALKYKGTSNVAFSIFGDGATSRGDWHEGVNFAAVQKLPVVYVCNNNQYAYSTPVSQADGVRERRRPRAGLRHARRDRRRQRRVRGVRRRRRAVAHARAGHGPYLIECKTFRMTGHSAHDAADYVPQTSVRRVGAARTRLLVLREAAGREGLG